MMRLAAFALRIGFAHADDGGEARRPGRLGLGRNLRIRLAMIFPPLGMTQDHSRRAGVFQHRRAEVAGEGARFVRAAILRPDGNDALGMPGRLSDQGGGRTHQNVTVRLAQPVFEGASSPG